MVCWLSTRSCRHKRSGHPNSSFVPESNKKLHKLFLADPKLKLHDIAEELKISKAVYSPICMKICQWESCVRVGVAFAHSRSKTNNDSERCLQLFHRNQKRFLRKYVTMDVTWIHHFTPESNQLSAEWTAAGEKPCKATKTQTSADKVSASVF